MTTYLDFASATAWLARQGFNRRDIECVLDLTRSKTCEGRSYWPSDRLERLAARAYWLGETEVAISDSAA